MIDIEKVLLSLDISLYSQRGEEVQGLCPMHKERTGKEDYNPSWWINTDTGAHICFSCGYKGNIYTLVQDLTGTNFKDAKAFIKDRVSSPIDSLIKRLQELPQYVQPSEQIAMSEARLAVYTDAPDIELKKRFLTREAVDNCGVRWNSNNSAWILPIRDPDNYALLGWQEKGARDRFFKNQPAGVKKSKTVFNVENIDLDLLIVVESPLDVVRLASLGRTGAVSTYGAIISEDQVKIMRRSKRVLAAFDNDDAGKKANAQIKDYSRKYGIDLLFFNYDGVDVKDVGDMTPKQVTDGLATARHALSLNEAYL
jgi:DNA primase